MNPEGTPPGLEGIVAGSSAICGLDEQSGILVYRGYPIEELAEGASYEEVAFLLLTGHLPSETEHHEFIRHLAVHRELPEELIQMIRATPRSAHPMDLLRTAVSYLGMVDPDRAGITPAAVYQKSVRLLAQMPMVVAAHYRYLHGKPPVEPDPKLSQAEQILFLLFGEPQEESLCRTLEVSLILYAEHEFNSSTFTARTTASTLADLHGAVTSGIASLKGPLHGGANEAVMRMLLEIETPDRAEDWVLARLRKGERIMGFGHRVLKNGDVRSEIMKRYAGALAQRTRQTRWYDISEAVEAVARREKGLFPNLDFYTASTYHLMGIPASVYTPIFACSRVAGWCAHVMEQYADNRLIRPRSAYTGPKVRRFESAARRGRATGRGD